MKRIALASIVATALLGGCAQHETRSEPAMTPAARTTGENDRTVLAITEQRCKRESYCNNIGPGKSYSSLYDCRSQINAKGYESLNDKACPRGVDRNALTTCLHSIEAEDCGNPIDSLERLVDCRSGKLCAD
jgi:hypothetical protein